MKKIIDNYIVVDDVAYEYVAEHCDEWLEKKISDPSQVIEKIIEAGGLVGEELLPGLYVLGNMYNPELGINGAIWITGEIIEVEHQVNGVYKVLTYRDSQYYLFNFDDDINNIIVSSAIDEATPKPDPDEVFKDPLSYYKRFVGTSS